MTGDFVLLLPLRDSEQFFTTHAMIWKNFPTVSPADITKKSAPWGIDHGVIRNRVSNSTAMQAHVYIFFILMIKKLLFYTKFLFFSIASFHANALNKIVNINETLYSENFSLVTHSLMQPSYIGVLTLNDLVCVSTYFCIGCVYINGRVCLWNKSWTGCYRNGHNVSTV